MNDGAASAAPLARSGYSPEGAKVDRTYAVKMFTRDAPSVTRKLTLRATSPASPRPPQDGA